jgi:hypothetical protein
VDTLTFSQRQRLVRTLLTGVIADRKNVHLEGCFDTLSMTVALQDEASENEIMVTTSDAGHAGAARLGRLADARPRQRLGCGGALALWPSEAPAAQITVRPRGLDPSRIYTVTDLYDEASQAQQVLGGALASGLEVSLPPMGAALRGYRPSGT